jgi:DNA-binding transcriptional LysR family regulator
MAENILNAVDLNLLKIFREVYQVRNVTRASDNLAMTQPAVSRALDRLRHLYKEKLFYREGGEMLPTRTAQNIAPFVIEGLSQLEAAINLARQFDPVGAATVVKLGANDYVASLIVPQLIETLSLEAPSVFLSTVPATYEDAAALLFQNKIDCAIVSSVADDPRIARQPILSEDYVVVSARDKLCVSAELSLDEYLACDHVLVSYSGAQSGWVDERLAEIGRRRRVISSVHLFAAVPHIILGKDYLCTLPRRIAMRLAANHPLTIHALPHPLKSKEHTFNLIWLHSLTPSPTMHWMHEKIADTCKALEPFIAAEADAGAKAERNAA